MDSTLQRGPELLNYLKENSPKSMIVSTTVIIVLLHNLIQSQVSIQEYMTYSCSSLLQKSGSRANAPEGTDISGFQALLKCGRQIICQRILDG